MGLICDPSEYGDDCLKCFPAGKTPKFLLLFFSGVKMGERWTNFYPLPQNGYHILQQNPGDNCRWDTLPGDPYVGYYRWWSVLWVVTYYPVGWDYMFGGNSHEGCPKYFDNFETEWEDNYYYGGHGYVTTCNQIADKVREVTPMFDPDPRLELFVNSGGNVVIRYAGKRDGTNIQIEVDTLI